MIATLQRIAGADHRALRRHFPGQRADRVRIYAGDGGCPVGAFRRSVGFPGQVGLEFFETDAIPFQEGGVVQSFAVQRVRQSQHQGDIRIRAGRQPLRPDEIRRVVPQRRYGDNLNAGVLQLVQPVRCGMLAGAARFNLCVLGTDTAKCDKKTGILRDGAP